MFASTLDAPPNALFVYGTLMQGQSHHSLLEKAVILRVTPASLPGELIDRGAYPALRLSPPVTSRVYGQLIEVERLASVLDTLDEYEGPEFRREVVTVSLGAGETRPAWTYVLAAAGGQFKLIPSGRWNSSAPGVPDSATLNP